MAQRYDDNLLEILNARSNRDNFESPDLGQFNAPPLNAGGTAGPAPTAPDPFKFGQSSVLDILGRYQHTPQGLRQAFDENPQLASMSQIGGNKGDKILDPTTGRLVDVIQAAGEGGKAWQWLDEASGGQGPYSARGVSPFMMDATQGMPTDTGFFEELMRMARQQAGLDRGQGDREALMSLIGGGR